MSPAATRVRYRTGFLGRQASPVPTSLVPTASLYQSKVSPSASPSRLLAILETACLLVTTRPNPRRATLLGHHGTLDPIPARPHRGTGHLLGPGARTSPALLGCPCVAAWAVVGGRGCVDERRQTSCESTTRSGFLHGNATFASQ